VAEFHRLAAAQSTAMTKAEDEMHTRVIVRLQGCAAFWMIALLLPGCLRQTTSSIGTAKKSVPLAVSEPVETHSKTITPVRKAAPSSWRAQHLGHHTYNVYSLAFSPNGKLLASGGNVSLSGWASPRRDPVRLWKIQTKQSLGAVAGRDCDEVPALAFSADGRTLAIACRFDRIQLWDVRRRRLKSVLVSKGALAAVAFSPNGKWLASETNDGEVRLWNLKTKKVQWVRSKTDDADLWYFASTPLAFSPDSNSLAVAAGGAISVQIISVLSGQVQRSLINSKGVYSVVFSPDGKKVVGCGGKDRLWDARTGKTLKPNLDLRGSAVAFSPDGRLLVVAEGREVRLGTSVAANGCARARGAVLSNVLLSRPMGERSRLEIRTEL
jgi:WD40 repeat protein